MILRIIICTKKVVPESQPYPQITDQINVVSFISVSSLSIMHYTVGKVKCSPLCDDKSSLNSNTVAANRAVDWVVDPSECGKKQKTVTIIQKPKI